MTDSARSVFHPEIYDLKPLERREIRIRIFGIDPSATAAAFNQSQSVGSSIRYPVPYERKSIASTSITMGEEHRVYVRRATTLSLAESTTSTESLPIIKNQKSKIADITMPLLPSLKEGKGPDQLRSHSPMNAVSNSPNSSKAPSIVDDENESVAGHDLIPYTGVSSLPCIFN